MRDKEPLLLQVGMQKSDGDVNILGKNRLKKWRCKVSVLLKWWLIILVQPTQHSIYTSKPWQFLIWWFNITYLFVCWYQFAFNSASVLGLCTDACLLSHRQTGCGPTSTAWALGKQTIRKNFCSPNHGQVQRQSLS